MGYYIRALPWKKKFPQWKVQFVSYKKSDAKESPAKKPKKEWDIPKDRWRALGFLNSFTVKEAKARVRQLNCALLIKQQEERLRQLQLEELQQQRRFNAFLPDEFKEEFEKRFLRIQDSETIKRLRKFSRAHIIWRAAQKLIIHIQLDPSEWFDNVHIIYDYFYENKFSLSYINKILSLTNLWGFFICRKIGKAFLPVPKPRGYERQRLVDTFYEKHQGRGCASIALCPEALEDVKQKIKAEQFNWLYLTVWLGLRPQEVDNLKDNEMWKIEELDSGRSILWVYQTKIVSLPPEQRWKAIPLLYDEQKFALSLIESQILERPSIKTMKKYFGPQISRYGGRKGFTDLMLEKGHSLEAISQWMGHAPLDRTWRSYKERRKIKFSLRNVA